ncbi:hypothetical protein ARMGADRAFT_1032959 [Armillaria gallica]|uniref:Uncharacterized protein n=1 Tax=Armillaria gallica TaxID=47427 RepID=A0A2H3D7Y6_ARMGA|nr:hypothetical protein ARMGADRAFT_1032959 [Armillaria gallica]
MSPLPNFTNFTFHCGQGVPSNWMEAHTRSLYDSILANPIQCTKNVWTPAHIQWMMKSIWFCANFDVDTGPSDGEGNDNEDVGYEAAQPPTILMVIDPPMPEGEPSRNETSEKWRVTSETRADSAAVQAAATLVGLVAYRASSDDGSGEDKAEDEAEVKEEVKPKKKSEADRKK